MGARRLVVLLIAGLLGTVPASTMLLPTASQAAVGTVGGDVFAGSGPSHRCASPVCTVVQLEGPDATRVTQSGTITSLRLRHGPVAGGLTPTQVRIVTLIRDGMNFTVRTKTGLRTLSAASGEDNKITFTGVGLPVYAGDYVGLQVTSGWAGDELVWLREESGQTAAIVEGNHETGTQTYGRAVGYRALFSVDVEYGGVGPSPSGSPTSSPTGSPTGSPSTSPTSTPTASPSGSPTSTPTETIGPSPTQGPFVPPEDESRPCPTSGAGRGEVVSPGATIRGVRSATENWADGHDRPDQRGSRPDQRGTALDRRQGAAGWRRDAFGRQDQFSYLGLELDGRGRPHVAALGKAHHGVHYFGPSRHQEIDNTVFDATGVGITIARNNAPQVVWGERKYTSSEGRLTSCPRLHLSSYGWHQVISALPESTKTAFEHTGVAFDAKTGTTHLAYDVNGRVIHRALRRTGPAAAPMVTQGSPTGLPMRNTAMVRIAAGNDVVVIGSKSYGGKLVVVASRGGGSFKPVVKAGAVRDFDVALDGKKPVVAWAGGILWQLNLHANGRTRHTQQAASALAIAVEDGRTHIGFSKADSSCGLVGCTHSGLYYALATKTRLGKATSVHSGRYESSQLGIGAHHGKVVIASSRNGVGYLYTKR